MSLLANFVLAILISYTQWTSSDKAIFKCNK